ncbi:MAG TPA: hypothetical protein VGE26_03925 [Sphingobacteriaceae bacterium]
MKSHSDEEIIRKASAVPKDEQEITDNRIDVAVDLDDDHGTAHTYVVTFQRSDDDWRVIEINELSSL